jgi:hypothetical protein
MYYYEHVLCVLQQRNLKQKFRALIRKFKLTEDVGFHLNIYCVEMWFVNLKLFIAITIASASYLIFVWKKKLKKKIAAKIFHGQHFPLESVNLFWFRFLV